ncbi:VOC family protein [Microbacterium sp. 22303]|uniref:VOC family protein n=1 Tax=Microbacterium sp. 22303 TaxID=3453905 RepID=UPI003F87EE81
MDVTPASWQVPAVPTRGEAPDQTRMDAVELLVRDLDGMTQFYQHAVTLDVLDQSGPSTTLGRAGAPVVTLRHARDLPSPDPRGAGLYHTAIVFEDQRRLAGALASMARRPGLIFEGSADHLVSEAFYFRDPEGNGLELYRDRPREYWNISADGSIQMGVDPLDPRRYLEQWYDEDAAGPDASAAIGHLHLQVGDISAAKRFYVDALGFDITTQIDTALFVSAGGYHHHIGLNTWNSAGVGPRSAALGLGDVRIIVPTRDDVDALADRLRVYGIAAADDGHALRFSDPWETRLIVSPAG